MGIKSNLVIPAVVPVSGGGSENASWGNITGTLSNQTDLLAALNDKQNILESGTNIKTINGSSLLGSGNLAVKTYQAFNSSWPTNTTFTAFLDAIRDDSTAVQGMAYLGELTCSGLPTGLANVEAVVEIMTSTDSNKVIHTTITSGNLSPYRWEYTYWNGGSSVSGWISWQTALPSGTTGYFLQKTDNGVQWAQVQSGSTPTLNWYKNNTGTTITIIDTSGANLVKVYKNGVLLEPTEDYSISGTTLTLVTALTIDDKILIERV